MKHPKKSAGGGWRVLARSGVILPSLLLSCSTLSASDWWWIDNCATIPKGAIPPPYGTHLNEILAGQHLRAEAEKFVISKHEWYLGGTAPGPAGRRHLAAIGDKLASTGFPVVIEPIEPEEDPDQAPEAILKLNEERRRKVVEYLAARGVVDADQRVILGYPTAEGLYGVPATLMGQRYLFTQGAAGLRGGGVGAFGGGGFGAGGAIGGVGTGFGGSFGGGGFF